MPPALAGRFLTTVLPGKSSRALFLIFKKKVTSHISGGTDGWSDRMEVESGGGEIRGLRLWVVLETDKYIEGEAVLEP